MNNTIPIKSILTGQVEVLNGSDVTSAIAKRPINGSIEVTRLGLRGDEQADQKHHGGIDKAVHHYPWDHYSFWQTHPGIDQELLSSPGAFGENLSSTGLMETDLCIGDIFVLGRSMLQVSQGRQPYSKLNIRFRKSSMMNEVLRTGYTGWYYRVLEEGTIKTGDSMELRERLHPEWTVRRVFNTLFHKKEDIKSLEKIALISELADSWKQITKRLLK